MHARLARADDVAERLAYLGNNGGEAFRAQVGIGGHRLCRRNPARRGHSDAKQTKRNRRASGRMYSTHRIPLHVASTNPGAISVRRPDCASRA